MSPVEWIERQTKTTFTENQRRCWDTLGALGAPYNWYLIGDGWDDAGWYDKSRNIGWGDDDCTPRLQAAFWHEHFVGIRVKESFSTYDNNGLTRLVLAAHHNAVRIEISHGLTYTKLSDYGYDFEPNEHEDTELMEPTSCLTIIASHRERSDDSFTHHPTLREALDRQNYTRPEH